MDDRRATETQQLVSKEMRQAHKTMEVMQISQLAKQQSLCLATAMEHSEIKKTFMLLIMEKIGDIVDGVIQLTEMEKPYGITQITQNKLYLLNIL